MVTGTLASLPLLAPCRTLGSVPNLTTHAGKISFHLHRVSSVCFLQLLVLCGGLCGALGKHRLCSLTRPFTGVIHSGSQRQAVMLLPCQWGKIHNTQLCGASNSRVVVDGLVESFCEVLKEKVVVCGRGGFAKNDVGDFTDNQSWLSV